MNGSFITDYVRCPHCGQTALDASRGSRPSLGDFTNRLEGQLTLGHYRRCH